MVLYSDFVSNYIIFRIAIIKVEPSIVEIFKDNNERAQESPTFTIFSIYFSVSIYVVTNAVLLQSISVLRPYHKQISRNQTADKRKSTVVDLDLVSTLKEETVDTGVLKNYLN